MAYERLPIHDAGGGEVEMDVDSLYLKLRFAQKQMIRAAGTAAHGTWKKIVRELDDKIKTLTMAPVSA